MSCRTESVFEGGRPAVHSLRQGMIETGHGEAQPVFVSLKDHPLFWIFAPFGRLSWAFVLFQRVSTGIIDSIIDR